MRDVLDDLLAVWHSGDTAVAATVVRTFDSAPREVGASMVVAPSGSVSGSVSGGCVEGAVYELAGEVARSAQPVLERYGVSDGDAFAIGLTCGGTLDVFVEAISQATYPDLDRVAADIRGGVPIAVATVVSHVDTAFVGRRAIVRATGMDGGLGSERIDAAVTDDAQGFLANGISGILTYGPDGERRGEGAEVFVSSFVPPPRMLVFGAIDFAAAVAQQGAFLGYRVTICDARPVFTTSARFPAAAEVIVQWPHEYLAEQSAAKALDERTVVCVLTHDPKFDVPLLEVALRIPTLAFVGAMGSRRTHEDRLARLRAAGLTDLELGRMSSPIGLDLGARTPQETAVSIAADIVARRWGGTGVPLTDRRGRIHEHR